jgi:hypothetical protein
MLIGAFQPESMMKTSSRLVASGAAGRRAWGW